MLEKMQSLIGDIIQKDYPAVSMAYLFGSRLEGNLGPLSDYDFGILLDKHTNSAALRSSLASELSRQLHSSYIDIVLLREAPIELAFAVISKGTIIYERNVETRVEFEARIMGLYFDAMPFLRMARQDIIEESNHAARVQRYRKAFGRTQVTLSQIRSSQREKSS